MSVLYEEFVNETRNAAGEITAVTYNCPPHFNFAYDVVDRLGREQPQKRALLWTDPDGSVMDVSFREVSRQSDRAAAMFLAHGIGKGDHVMLILKRHLEFWYCFMGLHKIGAIGVPATNQLMPKDIAYRCNAADVQAIVCTAQGRIAELVEQTLPECPTVRTRFLAKGQREGWLSLDAEMAGAPAFEAPAPDARPGGADRLFMYFSSGTTGMPKMVSHNHWYPLAHIPTAVYWHNIHPDDLHFTISETGWAKSMWGKLYGQWLAEGAVFVYDFDKFQAEDMLGKIQQFKITTFCAPPTIYRFLIREDLSRFDLSSLRHVTTAGEALNSEVYNRFLSATGLKLREGFGQTECTLLAATCHWTEPKPGSMGKPSPAYRLAVVDENGNPVETGQVGEIVVETSPETPVGLMIGYHNDPEMTAAAWHDGLYHTGDTAYLDEDGFLWYVGRTDDIIKSSGYRIGPFEVESVIMEHPAVVECAVTGAPDPVRGTVVKATLVLGKGYEPSEALATEIQEYVKSHTAPYKYPRIVEFVPELPKTISGKIRRTEIRAKDQQPDADVKGTS
jgi:acetyl-CoA synthetase